MNKEYEKILLKQLHMLQEVCEGLKDKDDEMSIRLFASLTSAMAELISAVPRDLL